MMFNPSEQVRFCRDEQRVFFGNAPRIGAVKAAYGLGVAESWLICQLNDLSQFAGARDKLSPGQIAELAAMIVETYPHYNLAEFMLFFQRFKRCEYGRFYGSVDPMVIMESLSRFASQRAAAHTRRREDDRRRLSHAQDIAHNELRQRYAQRINGAFTPEAPITFLQYQLMGYDHLSDLDLAAELTAIARREKTIPRDVRDFYPDTDTASDC